MARRSLRLARSLRLDALGIGSTLTDEQISRIRSNRDEAMRRRAARFIRPFPPIGWPVVAVPEIPQDFGQALPPLPTIRFLARLNAHAGDQRLVFFFFEDTIDDVKTRGSVTGVIHE